MKLWRMEHEDWQARLSLYLFTVCIFHKERVGKNRTEYTKQ
jgi:hypothetical protein